MDLQISVFLLFNIFTAGHCLSCYECNNMMGSCAYQKEITCGSGTQCMSSTKVIQFYSSFNGQKCYYCDEQSCSNILSCSGSEDRCFEATGSFGGHSMFVKGCVSKAICNATTSDPIVRDMSCCEGHLCNHPDSVARKTTQSFLLLCCSLLSFVLLH
ncbi:hypothetical protein cypCar_00046563 [Cyprinus carpio]|nr:hypothetical protein cypCar_00046563 [Cyprinus carpio]